MSVFSIGDKFRPDVSLVKELFKKPVDNLVNHVSKLLEEVSGCEAIVMVGGFSESLLLQEAVRKRFPSIKVVVPLEAGLAVLKVRLFSLRFFGCPISFFLYTV